MENQITRYNDEKVIQIEDHRATPEASAIRKLEEERFLAFLHTKNPKLRTLAFSILHDPVRLGSLELATKLNLSICQVDSLKRALRRATEEFSNMNTTWRTDSQPQRNWKGETDGSQ